ncbi:MAG: flagellar export protein FliJ [Candidatus Zixiibacteriota bacterium]|nr:MAG: flagellar export protein FliJ [candidate division Zixibacteria bacterium]
MKKFKYRLQALLKVKEHIERERQKALAESTGKVHDQENKLEAIEDDRAETFDLSRRKTRAAFSVAEMLIVSRYLHKLRRDTLVGRGLLRVLRKDRESKREELVEASRERKKYDKLRQHQRDKYHREVEAALTKESDENAIRSYRQRHRSDRSSN